MNIFDAFRKPVTKPLPTYIPIKLEGIRPASTLLFYGGNRLTELVGNRLYKHPYRPPAFHAAFYIGNPEPGLFLNVGKFKTIENVKDEYRSNRRIDVIVYKDLDDDQRRRLCAYAIQDTSHPKVGLTFPDYAFTDYLRFGLRFLLPSKKDFCSENVCEIFDTELKTVSKHISVNTAPWDLLEFAELNRDYCEVRTLWRGVDFNG